MTFALAKVAEMFARDASFRELVGDDFETLAPIRGEGT